MDTVTQLQQGDNDKKKKWAGIKADVIPDYTVTKLQNDLAGVGIYTSLVDGDFGRKTFKALKLFQWVCANIDACVKSNARISRALKPTILTTGKLNKATQDELKVWVDKKHVATGDLIRLSFKDFESIEAGPGFKKIASTSVKNDEMVISSAALPLLKEFNSKAKDKKVIIKINQAFRLHGVKVTGAVVTPSTKSQHLIGHAVDCNIVDGSSWNSKLDFKNKKATQNAKDIIKALKKSGYRWGGDFSPTDPPHFDKKLDSASFSYEAKFFFNQRMITENHPIPKQVFTKEAK